MQIARVPEPHLPQLLLDSINAMDAVSFDVFDTLFVRPLRDPEDAFDLLGAKFGIPNFPALRKQAQHRAFERMHKEGRHEITFDAIYASFDPMPVPAEIMRKAEYDLELALTLPNSQIIGLFRDLIGEGRKVVLTSDMYLPGSFFEELLRRNGLPDTPLFISSERNATKRDHGALFSIVAQDLNLPPDRILHIGDNPISDVLRGREAGFNVFHYIPARSSPPLTRSSPSASLASAVAKIHDKDIVSGTFYELGFHYGGPAAVGFLQWIEQRALGDGIDHLLFVSRDGYLLHELAGLRGEKNLPPYSYFKGSRTAFNLAAMDTSNFENFVEFLISGSLGLSASELFQRIGVPPPAEWVLADLDFPSDAIITPDNMDKVRRLIRACRFEILKVCRRNRRELFQYLNALGIRSGMKIGIVDIGWNGTTQEAFERAVKAMLSIQVTGYYFCLTSSPDCIRRQASHDMRAMIGRDTAEPAIVDAVYANRTMAELFFSAPHDAVIGYDVDHAGEILFVEDKGRGDVTDMRQPSLDMTAGAKDFALQFQGICDAAGFEPWPIDTVTPFLDLVVRPGRDIPLINDIQNFDCWGSTRNKVMRVRDYLP